MSDDTIEELSTTITRLKEQRDDLQARLDEGHDDLQAECEALRATIARSIRERDREIAEAVERERAYQRERRQHRARVTGEDVLHALVDRLEEGESIAIIKTGRTCFEVEARVPFADGLYQTRLVFSLREADGDAALVAALRKARNEARRVAVWRKT